MLPTGFRTIFIKDLVLINLVFLRNNYPKVQYFVRKRVQLCFCFVSQKREHANMVFKIR